MSEQPTANVSPCCSCGKRLNTTSDIHPSHVIKKTWRVSEPERWRLYVSKGQQFILSFCVAHMWMCIFFCPIWSACDSVPISEAKIRILYLHSKKDTIKVPESKLWTEILFWICRTLALPVIVQYDKTSHSSLGPVYILIETPWSPVQPFIWSKANTKASLSC